MDANLGPPAMPPDLDDQTSPTAPTLNVPDTGFRRASVNTTARSAADSEPRLRKPSKTNTVKTYLEPERARWQPGAEPGIDTAAGEEATPAHLMELDDDCDVTIIDFSDSYTSRSNRTHLDLAAFLEEPRPDDLPCRWISVNGLNWNVIKALGNKYKLHRLAIEDLIHTRSRTKVDWYADHAFIVLTLQKLVLLHHHKGRNDACDCAVAADDLDSDDDFTEKATTISPKPNHWWSRKEDTPLPRYKEHYIDAHKGEFVHAHSGLSSKSPIKPVRTLHRYESAQIPKHTAFMEKNSALTKDHLSVSVEQVCIFLLADNTVISFFELSADDVEEPILRRLNSKETMLRRSCDASMVTQAIIDAIVDLAVPVRDAYNKSRKELQIDAMTNPNIATSRALHIFGEEIDMLQNLFKPIVQLVNALRDHNSDPFSTPSPPRPTTTSPPSSSTPHRATPHRTQTATTVRISPLAHTYFGDVLDHCITLIAAFEQMDASANNISTLIFNTVGARTNNFMMILAVVTVLFAPLTFISGYFGMNFAGGMGLDHPFAFFWVVAIPSLVAFSLVVFATMAWDNLRDLFVRRGAKGHFWGRRRK